ncbi:MAG: ABC transporter ATP-binding protein [Bacillota bacterium]
MSVAPIIEMKHITKRFPGVVANKDVSLQIYPGEIHALLGENGAGKSSLMNVLTGLYRPDEGEILYHGKPCMLKSPKDAVRLGIGMVHQHFNLVEPLSVCENVFLGSAECKNFLRMGEMCKRVKQCSEEFGLAVDPSAKIWQLSVGEQQRVEIVKLLFRGTQVLILDEPTAVLTPQETEKLFDVLSAMKAKGKAIVFITHKLYEVMRFADRISVLRQGSNVATMLRSEIDQGRLTQMMVGSSAPREQTSYAEQQRGKILLRLKGVCALNDKNLPALNHVDLDIHESEIVGIAGISGNGQKELAEVISGLRPITDGTILIEDQVVTKKGFHDFQSKSLAFVPEDRLETGLVRNFNLLDNIVLRNDKAYSKFGFLNYKKVSAKATEIIRKYNIQTTGAAKPVKLMSGGNQQKLLFGRETDGAPKLIIAAYPVRGLDINAAEEVHRILLEQKAGNAAILLISEDLEEIFEIADRIAVLFKGEITGILESKNTTYEQVGRLMVGFAQEDRI